MSKGNGRGEGRRLTGVNAALMDKRLAFGIVSVIVGLIAMFFARGAFAFYFLFVPIFLYLIFMICLGVNALWARKYESRGIKIFGSVIFCLCCCFILVGLLLTVTPGIDGWFITNLWFMWGPLIISALNMVFVGAVLSARMKQKGLREEDIFIMWAIMVLLQMGFSWFYWWGL